MVFYCHVTTYKQKRCSAIQLIGLIERCLPASMKMGLVLKFLNHWQRSYLKKVISSILIDWVTQRQLSNAEFWEAQFANTNELNATRNEIQERIDWSMQEYEYTCRNF